MSDNLVPRRSVGYPGRGQLDQASTRFRRAAARLHREALIDETLAGELEPIVDAAVAALHELSARAELAAGKASRIQKRTRRQVREFERQARRLPAGSPTREVVEQTAARLRSSLPSEQP